MPWIASILKTGCGLAKERRRNHVSIVASIRLKDLCYRVIVTGRGEALRLSFIPPTALAKGGEKLEFSETVGT
jgi:hypothetical protein